MEVRHDSSKLHAAYNAAFNCDDISDGSTAVHRACYNGNCEALQLLIQYHAKIGMQDEHGRAPLHWASIASTSDCLQVS